MLGQWWVWMDGYIPLLHLVPTSKGRNGDEDDDSLATMSYLNLQESWCQQNLSILPPSAQTPPQNRLLVPFTFDVTN